MRSELFFFAGTSQTTLIQLLKQCNRDSFTATLDYDHTMYPLLSARL